MDERKQRAVKRGFTVAPEPPLLGLSRGRHPKRPRLAVNRGEATRVG